MRNYFYFVALLLLLLVGCTNKTSKNNKVVEAKSYNRKCSVFESIPQVDSTKSEIIFLGHSLINEFLVDEYIPHGDSIAFVNMGIGGDDTRGVYNRRNLAFERNPKLIVMELGINDILNSEPMDSICKYYGLVLEEAKSRGINMIVCATIPNLEIYLSQIETLNAFLKEKSAELQFRYLDIFTPMLSQGTLDARYDCGDNTHLTGAGYKLWADSLKQYLW